MYVVTESGKKLSVDDSAIKDDSWLPFQQTVGLYDDSTILKEVWILELNKRDFFARMSAYGCIRGDIAIVRKGYELDMEGD